MPLMVHIKQLLETRKHIGFKILLTPCLLDSLCFCI